MSDTMQMHQVAGLLCVIELIRANMDHLLLIPRWTQLNHLQQIPRSAQQVLEIAQRGIQALRLEEGTATSRGAAMGLSIRRQMILLVGMLVEHNVTL